MSAQAIMQNTEESFKATSIKELRMITKILAYLHAEINDYQKLYTMCSIQFANKLFKDSEEEIKENTKNALLEYQSKLSAYKNVTEVISQLIKEDK